MTATDDNSAEAATPDLDDADTTPEEQRLPEDALAEGFQVPEDHSTHETIDLVRRFRRASPGPYSAFYRVRRIVNGAEQTLGNVDMRQWDEGEYAEGVDAGDYVRRLIVTGGGGGVNKTLRFTVAKPLDSPRTPARGPARTGAVVSAAELQEMREQHAEILEALRTRREPAAQNQFVAILPTCITAATGILKMVMDNRPSTLDLIAMMDKRSGMGELSEAIRTMRDLASDVAPGGEGGSLLADLIQSTLPSVVAELKANREALGAATADPAPTTAAPQIDQERKEAEEARTLLRAIVEDLLRGAQSPGAEASAYASVLFDRLEHARHQGGAVARTAEALVKSLADGEVGDVAALLVGAAPALGPYADWVAEIEAEMRTFTTSPETGHEEEEEEDDGDGHSGAEGMGADNARHTGPRRTEAERTPSDSHDNGAGAG